MIIQQIFNLENMVAGVLHIPKRIIPRIKNIGINEEQIQMSTVENPKRIISFWIL